MKGKNLDKKLLQKFKAGKCSPEEVRKILLWYQSEEAETSFSLELENYWHEENDLPFLDKGKVYDQVRKRIGGKGKNRNPISKRIVPQNKRGLRYHAKLAAVIVLLLISAPLLYFKTALFETPPRETSINWISKETTFGQRYTIKLPDGTLVKLNSGSRIHYPEAFSDSLRLVEFEGEAFFEVAKDTAKPFMIKSRNINTMVLGTSFNLKTTAAENFELAVVTGSVKVFHSLKEQSMEEWYINPSQSIVLDHQSQSFQIHSFDPATALAWVEGILVFDNSSFEDIVYTLEKWYGVHIDTSDLNQNIPTGYTGKYKDKSLETVLKGISYVLDFRYEIKGKKVLIK